MDEDKQYRCADLMVGRRGRGAGGVRRTRLPWAEGDSVPVVPIVSSETTSRNDSRPFRRVWAFAARRPEIVVQPEYATAAEFQCLTRADDRGGPVARCGYESRRSPVVLPVVERGGWTPLHSSPEPRAAGRGLSGSFGFESRRSSRFTTARTPWASFGTEDPSSE
jgi:hypothetical protein